MTKECTIALITYKHVISTLWLCMSFECLILGYDKACQLCDVMRRYAIFTQVKTAFAILSVLYWLVY